MTLVPHHPGAATHWAAFDALSPARIEAILTLAGLPARRIRRALHLGCGRGVNVAILGACGVEAWGWEEDEAAAADARQLADAAGGARILSGALSAFAARDDLPDFDLIALPEGWTEAPEDAREEIVALLARRLVPGGVFHLVHDVEPGAAEEAPLRQLLRNRWEALPTDMPVGERIPAALDSARTALRKCHALFRGYGGFDAQLAEASALPPELAARRWFAPRRAPASIRRTAARLAPAGLSRIAPADPARLVRDLDHTPEQQAMIDACRAETGDVWLAEELADLASRRLRRSDLFVRDGGPECAADRSGVRLVATCAPETFGWRAEGLLGEIALSRAAYGPLLEALEARGSMTLADLATRAGAPLHAVAERAAVLISCGAVAPAEEPDGAAGAGCRRLNEALCEAGPPGFGPAALAAPLLGGPIAVAPGAMPFAAALLRGAAADAAALRSKVESARAGPLNDAAAAAESERFVREDVRILRAVGAAPEA